MLDSVSFYATTAAIAFPLHCCAFMREAYAYNIMNEWEKRKVKETGGWIEMCVKCIQS